MKNEKGQAEVFLVIILIVVGVLLFLSLFWIWPTYHVWAAGKSGEALLKEADYSRQTKVVEAQANLQAETLNAQAEVVRAGGVAQSNQIIKGSIDEMYIRYLWVKTLDGAQKEVIYVPTEGNLPITEATRLQPPAQK